MLYISSEVKMEGRKYMSQQRKSGGHQKFFMPELEPHHVQFASYATKRLLIIKMYKICSQGRGKGKGGEGEKEWGK